MRILPASIRVLVAVLLVALALTPGAAAAQQEEHLSIVAVSRGFDLLMDRLVYPMSSDVLLGAGWQSAASAAEQALGTPASVPVPLLNGDRHPDWEVFEGQWVALDSELDGVLESGALARETLKGMADAVNEGHTVYLDPARYAEHLAWGRGDLRYAGIGARIAQADGTVVEVFDGSPAEVAGLQVGDQITHVDGVAVTGHPLAETISRVRGEAGTAVFLTLRRAGFGEPLTLGMLRSEIQIAMVRSQMLRDGVGYVRLRSFPEPIVADQVSAAVGALRDQGATALILDLRGNSGGRLDVGRQVLGLFVEDGPLYQQRSRDGRDRTTYAIDSATAIDLPLAVLVDGGTASMGEIFAAAIQEHDAGWIVGETTAGNVAAAQVFPLGDGSALQVTVMEIRSGQGRQLNQVGVVPDVPAATSTQDLRLGVDVPIETALDLLTRPSLAPARPAA